MKTYILLACGLLAGASAWAQLEKTPEKILKRTEKSIENKITSKVNTKIDKTVDKGIDSALNPKFKKKQKKGKKGSNTNGDEVATSETHPDGTPKTKAELKEERKIRRRVARFNRRHPEMAAAAANRPTEPTRPKVAYKIQPSTYAGYYRINIARYSDAELKNYIAGSYHSYAIYVKPEEMVVHPLTQDTTDTRVGTGYLLHRIEGQLYLTDKTNFSDSAAAVTLTELPDTFSAITRTGTLDTVDLSGCIKYVYQSPDQTATLWVDEGFKADIGYSFRTGIGTPIPSLDAVLPVLGSIKALTRQAVIRDRKTGVYTYVRIPRYSKQVSDEPFMIRKDEKLIPKEAEDF